MNFEKALTACTSQKFCWFYPSTCLLDPLHHRDFNSVHLRIVSCPSSRWVESQTVSCPSFFLSGVEKFCTVPLLPLLAPTRSHHFRARRRHAHTALSCLDKGCSSRQYLQFAASLSPHRFSIPSALSRAGALSRVGVFKRSCGIAEDSASSEAPATSIQLSYRIFN